MYGSYSDVVSNVYIQEQYIYIVCILQVEENLPQASVSPESSPTKKVRATRKRVASDKREKANSNYQTFPMKFRKEYVDILEELALAFNKAGAIDKPTVTALIRWNTERLVEDVMEKKKKQLIEQLKREAELKAKIELDNKLKAYGIHPSALQQSDKVNNQNGIRRNPY